MTLRKGLKHRLVPVTDPAEIAAIESPDLGAPIGGLINGVMHAERSTLEAYRKAVAQGERHDA